MSNRALAPREPSGPEGPDLPQAADCAAMRWADGVLTPVRERLVEEEPLAVEIRYARSGQEVRKLLSVTMRTPGDDADLALGFLYCESLIEGPADVLGWESLAENARGERIATWSVRLAAPPRAQGVERVSRGLLTSAACGLCGRTSLEGLRVSAPGAPAYAPAIPGALLLELPERLRQLQMLYPETGACHGAGLFDASGVPLVVREDVGRHNAVDKVIGAALRAGVTLPGQTLVLSGRAGFELVQKAAAAGISLVVSVGAPSALAVRLATQASITLAGFARNGRFNLYTQAGRLVGEGSRA